MVELFEESYPKIVAGEYTRFPQDTRQRVFHYAKDIYPKTRLKLDDTYTVKEILNLLRAKMFPPYEGCTFEFEGHCYEVSVSIKEVGK